ncbi:MAG: MATE family efflux transporter [Candidatus Harrisonbacteria bacterium CG10_big_fil_rev_8_21_14_0_10_45_28]|uniref:Multidrug-efflux transporter n=1 Tax=Candidatus Harrisonbacteria bacterium CG10_big_fil_rev_8_21_14_0_10_45_28 TaxID=1974586 RepID=A0A2H0UNF0_9BACT|nr:MAG: MATE family efflux transporter [Candidatus Harrisonbacteria bacterium CG10_big_fil_rev_8_21_14_0_10_45_28]
MFKSKSKNLTEGPIFKSILVLAIPIIFSSLLQTTYNLTDTFWVGRLGAGAVAAVSLSFPVMFLIFAVGGGLAVAGTILVAQYKGKKDEFSVDHVTSQTFSMMFIVSILIGIIGYLISPSIISFIGADAIVNPMAIEYLRVSFLGVLFVFIYYVFESLMRGVGNAKTPVFIVSATVLLNLVLDPLFIFGWGPFPAMGVSGAALATVCTQALAAIVGVILLFSGRYGLRLKFKSLKPDFPLIRKMFFLGMPSSIEQSSRALSFVFLTLLAAKFGTIALAAYGIRNRISSFLILPALGLAVAASAIIGQNLGAQKPERAQKTAKAALIATFISLTTLGMVFFIFAENIIGWFVPGDLEVIKMGTLFLRITAPTLGLLGIEIVAGGILRGAGATASAMTLAVVSLWVLHIPVAFLLVNYTSLSEVGLWISFAFGNVTGATLGLILLKKSNWQNKNLTAKFGSLSTQITDEALVDEGLSA